MFDVLRVIVEKIFFSTQMLDYAQLKQQFQHKTILITGASFGIGEQIARCFAHITCHLILVARSQEQLEQLAEHLRVTGCQVDVLIQDFYCDQAAIAIDEFLKSRNYQVDLLIHNAGKSIQRSIWQSLDRPQDIDRTIRINYINPAQLTRRLLSDLKHTRGQVIAVSTINCKLFAPPLWSSYQASKTALQQWLLSIRPELQQQRVAVSLVYLPLVRTRMIAPTQHYQHMPAMTAQQAAHAVLSCALTRKRSWQPWWLTLLQLCCWILSRPLQQFYRYYLNRQKY